MSAGNAAQTDQMLEQIRAGVPEATDQLFALHRPELRAFIDLRLDPKLRRRLDASDVVQETLMEASRRLGDYLAEPALPFHLWLRQIAKDRLIMAHRRHVLARGRSLNRQVPLAESSRPTAAAKLVDSASSPSQHLARQETSDQVRQAIDRLPEADRTILLLRNHQSLSNQEAAAVLGIDPVAASQRYGRALRRLDKLLNKELGEKAL
jgi:RNA polymerase sigma-70 factor (ECF subfamily)